MTTIKTPNKERINNAIQAFEVEASRALAERLEAEIAEEDALECSEIVGVIRDHREDLFNNEPEPARWFYIENVSIVRGIRNRVIHKRGPSDISDEDCRVMIEQIAAALHWLNIEGAPSKVREYASMDEVKPSQLRRPQLRSLIPQRNANQQNR